MRATLVFDSWRAGTRLGTRGTGRRDRSLLFRAGEYSVELLITGGPGPRLVVGQIVSEAGGTAVYGAKIVADGSKAVSDRFGQFSLRPVLSPARATDIKIRDGREEIVCSLALPDA